MSEHHDDHHHPAPLSPVEVRALEELLKEKSLIQEGFIGSRSPSSGLRIEGCAAAPACPSIRARRRYSG